MNRILFAAARGARVQWRGRFDPKWVTAESVSFGPWSRAPEQIDRQRIHPDDEHLAYGPVSTALREMAIYGTERPEDDTWWCMARDYFLRECIEGCPSIEYRSLFLLILSEALADQGL